MLIHKKIWQILTISGIIILLFSPAIFKLIELKYKCTQLERQIAALQRSNLALTKERERLLNDPQYAEEIAREKMNMAREGEIVYKVIDKREQEKVNE